MTVISKSIIGTTLVSFLAYFVMSAVISPIGSMTAPIAERYNVGLPEATAVFTFLTAGFLVGSLIAMVVFDKVKLKAIIAACFSGVILGALGMYFIDSFALLPVLLFLVGLVCGINLAAAIVVITASYSERRRASMMLLTDSFYSMAGVASTFLAGYLVARSWHWSSAYVLACGAAILALVVTWLSTFPPLDQAKETTNAERTSRWPASVFLVGLAITAYLVGFGTLYSWLPNYTEITFSADPGEASQIVSRLFLGMFIGQLVMFVLLLRVNQLPVLGIAAIAATLLTALLWSAGDAGQLGISALSLGLVTGGLFKLMVSFGTTLVDAPTPRMISFLIFCAAIGTVLAPAVSAVIVEVSSINWALKFATGCYCMMLLMLIGANKARAR